MPQAVQSRRSIDYCDNVDMRALDLQREDTILPVAIIGGGPVGLISSILLSMRRIPHRVFEQFPGTSIHPKACGLNQRTVEIFRHVGIEESIKLHRAPLDVAGRTGWYTGVGPDSREIYSRDSWGGGKYQQEYLKASPVQYSTLAQIRLEPILKRRALQLNPDGIQYTSKVTSVQEKCDRVSLEVIRDDGRIEKIDASYVIGADGGRGLAESLGIGWEGESDITNMVTAHFRADISSMHPDKRVFISWLMNPRLKGSHGAGYLYHLGPYHPVREPKEEWVLAAPRFADDPDKFEAGTMIDRIRRSLETPELEIDLLSLSHWTVNAKVTERYRSEGGRVFLVGDACHRVPPWGALGMNTGVQDAYNLIWKLGLAIKSGSSTTYNDLLNTYEVERKPIAVRVARNSLNNMRNHANVMDRAVGITADTTTEQNLTALEAFFDKSHPEHLTKTGSVQEASRELDHEFHAPGVEIGWFYPSADVNGEGEKTRHAGQVNEDGSFDFTSYHPSTIPGHHVPHAWLTKDNQVVSTCDLKQHEGLVLLTRRSGLWNILESEDVHVQVISQDGDWIDRDGTWAELCGVQETGAVLMRPDGIVAWRAEFFSDKAVQVFPNVLASVLGRAHGHHSEM